MKAWNDRDLIERVLELIHNSNGWNPYIAYQNLPKTVKEKYSLDDLILLFHRLEWNVKVIEISEVYESTAFYPWKEGASGHVIKKKVARYQLRDEFLKRFSNLKSRSELVGKIIEHINDENEEIIK